MRLADIILFLTPKNSDPEPDEIKTAMSSGMTYEITPEMMMYRKELGDESYNINNLSAYDPAAYNMSMSGSSPTTASTSTATAFNFAPSSTTTTTNSSSLSSSRQSWMNGSDMELDEELPPLNIDRTGSASSSGGQPMSEKEIKTQEVINELIHTEQKHVRNLKIMKHHFYLPIKINMYLTKEELNIMFPNLEQVLDLHCIF